MKIKTIIASAGVGVALLTGGVGALATGIAAATPPAPSTAQQDQQQPDRGPYIFESHGGHRHTPGGEARHGRHAIEGKVKNSIKRGVRHQAHEDAGI